MALLNELSGQKYRGSGVAIPRLHARHCEYGDEAVERVIRVKCWTWIGTKWEKYLRPETLFRPTKFDGYLNERLPKIQARRPRDRYSPAEEEQRRMELCQVERIPADLRRVGAEHLRRVIGIVDAQIARAMTTWEAEGCESSLKEADRLSKSLEELQVELTFLEADR